VKGGLNIPFVKDITFGGTGKINERTDDKLDFSFDVTVLGQRVSAQVTAVYKEDGGTNRTDFDIKSTSQKANNIPTNIQSLPNERILTPIGGLELITNAPFFPLPEKVTLKVVHIRPKQGAVELESEVAGLPNAFIQASKKSAAGKK
jgi:hypothetical protein